MPDRLSIDYCLSRLPFLLVSAVFLVYGVSVLLARLDMAARLLLLLVGAAMWLHYLVILARPAVRQLVYSRQQWLVCLSDSEALLPVRLEQQKAFVSSWLLVLYFNLDGRCLPPVYLARDNVSEAQFRALCRQLLL